MRFGSVYKIVNLLNGKVYVGQTTSKLSVRWKMHKCASRNNRSNSILHAAIAKYGIDAFSIEELCSCFDKSELDQQEQFFILKYNTLVPNGYNLKHGGANGKHTNESILAMKISRQKLLMDPTYVAKITKYLQDFAQNMTDEDRRHHSACAKQYWSREENRVTRAIQNKAHWETLPKAEQDRRTRGLKGYWNAERAQIQSDRMKSLDPAVKAKIISKAKEGKLYDIIATNVSTGEATVYPSLNVMCRILKLRRNTVSNHIQLTPDRAYQGYTFKRVLKQK